MKIVRRVAKELGVVSSLLFETSPAFPIVADRLRLRQSDYMAAHRATGLTFSLKPRTGDWFTFYECCLRQDYFPEGFRLCPADKVLDIGGNFGAFALMAARKVGPNGIVHCYEPSPVSAERIKWHAEQNRIRNIEVIQGAVGGKSGEISLFVHEKSALTTTMQDVDGRRSDGLTSEKVVQVAISEALTALPGQIAIAKIDCEGAEYEIMDQILPVDLTRIRAIAMETHKVPGRDPEEIISKLRKNGFEVRKGNPMFAINLALG